MVAATKLEFVLLAYEANQTTRPSPLRWQECEDSNPVLVALEATSSPAGLVTNLWSE